MGSNGLGAQELAVDNFSLSPQCFGLAVNQSELRGWRYNMTDEELCVYFGEN
jgi:hypothetical protein